MKKLTTLVLALVMIFSISCACAASDETATAYFFEYSDAADIATQFALEGYEVESSMITYGAAMLKADICSFFCVMVVGLDNAYYNNCDFGYWYNNENGLMVLTNSNITCTFPVSREIYGRLVEETFSETFGDTNITYSHIDALDA